MEDPKMFSGYSLKRLAQGVAIGAVATIFIGFYWGGWVRGGVATDNTTKAVNAALVQVYGPVCAEKFQQQANAKTKLAELGSLDSWKRDDYIMESGFATPPGATSPNTRIADACSEALMKIIALQTQTPPAK